MWLSNRSNTHFENLLSSQNFVHLKYFEYHIYSFTISFLYFIKTMFINLDFQISIIKSIQNFDHQLFHDSFSFSHTTTINNEQNQDYEIFEDKTHFDVCDFSFHDWKMFQISAFEIVFNYHEQYFHDINEVTHIF